jgi:hypothetical protein
MKTGSHDVASFSLVVSILGALAGVVAGYGLDRIVDGRRLLAILASVFAVVVIIVFRSSLGRLSPSLQIGGTGSRVSSYLWVAICLSTIIGGLAGHDLCELFQISSGAVIGFASGSLAAVSIVMLMILYFHAHPEAGVEF